MRRKGMKEFWMDEDGMGTVEIILIIVVLVGLVLIFRKQMTSIVNSLFEKISDQTDQF
jgi:Flp pilus assembly pilin Flp